MILSAQQQREWDTFTIKNEPISSINLMERASRRWIEHMRPLLDPTRKIYVVAGFGNNGGDALAIARLLLREHFAVRVFLASFQKELSPDCKVNLERLPGETKLSILNSEKDLEEIEFNKGCLIIDGLFGSGLTRQVTGNFGKLIDAMNNADGRILSIDVPSGVFTDRANEPIDARVKARATGTFQATKLGFLFPENSGFVGAWHVIDIGLHSSFVSDISLNYSLTSQRQISDTFKPRATFSHKGSHGHSIIIQGTKTTSGAAILAAKAAMTSGSGLTTLLTDHSVNLQYPELMTQNFKALNTLKDHTFCIGPGLGTDDIGKAKLKKVLELQDKPVVIDADALNIIADDSHLIDCIPENSVLTPHPKELARLIGDSDNSFEQLEKAKAFAREHAIVLLIKRAYTVVIEPNGAANFNSTGNSGLAKGGSGDVLSGIICGLMAQGYQPIEAARLGVYVHGLAADLARTNYSSYSINPLMVVDHISAALLSLGV